MSLYNIFKVYLNYLFFIYSLFVFLFYFNSAASENNHNIIINAEEVSVDNQNEIVNARGNISIQTEKFLSASDTATYNQKIDEFTSSGNVIIKDNNIINNNNNNIMKRDISNLETYVTSNSNKNRTCINTIVENYIKKYKIDVTRNSLKTINDITKKLNFINQYKN